jgi:hypothetical protein
MRPGSKARELLYAIVFLFPESPETPESMSDYYSQCRIFDQLSKSGTGISHSLIIGIEVDL